MSHEIESIAWTNEVPWHGLGKQVSGDLTPAQMVKAASLDWTVSKRRLYMQGLTDKDDDLVVPGFFALTRDSDSKVLDIVGPQYVPTQNIEAFSFFDNFVKAGGATMETAGSLRGGKMVWGLAKLKRIGPKGDPVDAYLLVSSPHQQGKTMTISMTAIRVVCNNTLRIALRSSIGEKFRHIHRREFTPEVQKQAAETIGAASEVIDAFEADMNAMRKMKITIEQGFSYLRDVFGEDEDAEPTKIHAQARAALEHAPGHEKTMWGAFNAVTYVTDHLIGKSPDRRLERAWFGKTAAIKRRALDLALNR